MEVKIPFQANVFGATYRIYQLGRDEHLIARDHKMCISIKRAEDDGILLQRWNGKKFLPLFHSKTPFDRVRESTELLIKIIKASV